MSLSASTRDNNTVRHATGPSNNEKLLFRREEWAGRNRSAAAECPRGDSERVGDARHCHRQTTQRRLSGWRVSPVEWKIPERSAGLQPIPSESCFGKQKPTDRVDALLTRPLLTERAISIIKKCSLRAWLDGYQSLDDSRYANARLPLQAVAVLDRLSLAEKGVARCYDVA